MARGAQEAKPAPPSAASKPLTEAEARERFAKVEVCVRTALPEGSEERADAARNAAVRPGLHRRLVSGHCRQDGKSLAGWFAKNAALDEEVYKTSRIYLLAQSARWEVSIKDRKARLAAAADAATILGQRRVIHIFRDAEVGPLISLRLMAHGQNNLVARLRYRPADPRHSAYTGVGTTRNAGCVY